MEKLVEQGLAKYLGVINFNIVFLSDLLRHAKIPPRFNKVELNPNNPQNELWKFCNKNDIKLIAYNPIYRSKPSTKRFEYEKYDLLNNEAVLALAVKYNKTPAQIVINWIVNRDIIVITKSSNGERQRENLESNDFRMEEYDYGNIDLLNKEVKVYESLFK
jgi:diketogulonate reductase-like aldo/keto reductase